MRPIRAICTLSVCALLSGCGPDPPAAALPWAAGTLPPGVRQAVVVRPAAPGSSAATVSAAELKDGEWKWFRTAIPGVVGRNGFAPPGEKREGDGRTPSGVFRIGLAFGTHADFDESTALDYRVATADDFWVDDPASPQYNRWVHGKPDAK